MVAIEKIKNNDNRDAIKSHLGLLIDCLALPMKHCMENLLFVSWDHIYGELAWATTMRKVCLTGNNSRNNLCVTTTGAPRVMTETQVIENSHMSQI